MEEVFIVQNVSSNDIELLDFGVIVAPAQIIELERFDEGVLSNNLKNYLLNGDIIRFINDVSVPYSEAFMTSNQISVDSSLNLLFNETTTINASLAFYATNASVGLALYPYATNASVNSALTQFIKSSSTGVSLYWKNGILDLSVGSIPLGKNLTFDASSRIAVVNSPNFSGEVSIGQNLDVSGYIVSRLNLSGQSLIKLGLIVNNDASSSPISNFIVKTLNYDAIDVSAGNNSLMLMNSSLGKIGFFGTVPTIKTFGWNAINGTGRKTIDVSQTTPTQIVDLLASLVNELKAKGIIG